MEKKAINWKVILIIVGILFLISSIIRVILYMQFKTTAQNFNELAQDAENKSKEAMIRVVGSTISIGLEDWKNKHGDYSNFVENVDITKLRPSMAGDLSKADVDYKVFTTKQDYVVKLKPTNQKIIYCLDQTATDVKIIPFDENNLESSTNCNGENLK